MPIVWPSITAAAVLAFVGNWNEFLVALIATSNPRCRLYRSASPGSSTAPSPPVQPAVRRHRGVDDPDAHRLRRPAAPVHSRCHWRGRQVRICHDHRPQFLAPSRSSLEEANGAILKLAHQGLSIELVTETRLAGNFRLLCRSPIGAVTTFRGRDQKLRGWKRTAKGAELSYGPLVSSAVSSTSASCLRSRSTETTSAFSIASITAPGPSSRKSWHR